MNVIVFFVLCLGSFAQGAPRIVKPYPNNVYAIENEKTQVTCVVEDTVSNPDEIIFVRKSRFGDIIIIRDEGPDGRIYYQNETLDGGRKLQVTLHFNKVILNDDSRNGGYECHGYTGANRDMYGFTVTVIERSEFPVVQASDNVTAEFGDQIQLTCNVTIKQAFSTTISKFIWKKDRTNFLESYCPRLGSIKPLIMNVSTPDVGGVYNCYLEYKLRNVIKKEITKSIVVKVKPKFFAVKKERKAIKLVCSAQGNPLVTEWKRKSQQDDKIVLLNAKEDNPGSEGKPYVFSNMNAFKDHTLTIYDTQQTGQYYCCIKDANTIRAPEDVENCQIFDVNASSKDSSSIKPGFKISLILLSLLLIGLLFS